VKRLLRTPEAAEYLGVSENYFREQVLPAIERVYVGSCPRVDVKDLDAWVDRQKATSSDGAASDAAGLCDSRSTARGLSSAQASEAKAIERRLTERVARSTRSTSRASANAGQVIDHPTRHSRRGSANG
jgi:hypothetical protein